eukprot:2154891-Prymnesium_polylepis.1
MMWGAIRFTSTLRARLFVSFSLSMFAIFERPGCPTLATDALAHSTGTRHRTQLSRQLSLSALV